MRDRNIITSLFSNEINARRPNLDTFKHAALQNLKHTHTIRSAIGANYLCVDYAPGGNLLAASQSNGSIVVLDSDTKHISHEISAHEELVTGIKWFNTRSADESQGMFITTSLDKTIRLFRDYECACVFSDHNDWIRAMDINNDDSRFVTGCISAMLTGFDLEVAKPVWQIKTEHDAENLSPINNLAFGKHSRDHFASGKKDGSVSMWDFRDVKQSVFRLHAHNGKINSVQYTNNDQHLVSASRDSTIKVWDIRMTGSRIIQPIKTFDQHVSKIYNVPAYVFNNEQYLVTGSETGTIVIYDFETGEVVNNLYCPEGMRIIHTAVPREDGMQIVSLCVTIGSMTIWQPSLGKGKNYTQYVEEQPQLIEGLLMRYGEQILKAWHRGGSTQHDAFALHVNCQLPQDEEFQVSDALDRITDINVDIDNNVTHITEQDEIVQVPEEVGSLIEHTTDHTYSYFPY